MNFDKVKVDLTDWILFSDDEEKALTKMLRKCAKELVNILIRDDVSVHFPKEWAPKSDGWSDDEVDDPLTIYIVANDEGKILKKLSLTEALEETIEACEDDGSFAYGLNKISEVMKRLTARIGKAIEKHGIDADGGG